jgi:hypothetical protein
MKSLIFAFTMLVGSFAFAGQKYSCTELNPKPGATRSLTLTRVGKTSQWKLEVFSTVIVPNAKPTLILSSILTVTLAQDVQFNLENTAENVSFEMYLDQQQSNYLYLPSEADAVIFKCL